MFKISTGIGCVAGLLAAASVAQSAPYVFTDTLGQTAEMDVEYWTGAGDHETILVVDWNTAGGPYVSECHAFGYRWDGSATTVQTMLTDITGNGGLAMESGYGGGFVMNLTYADGDGDSHAHTELGSFNLGSTGDLTSAWGNMSPDWTMLGEWEANGMGIDSEWIADGQLEGINTMFWFDSSQPYMNLEAPFIPEPATLTLLGIGGLLMLRRRKLQQVASASKIMAVLLAVGLLSTTTTAQAGDVVSADIVGYASGTIANSNMSNPIWDYMDPTNSMRDWNLDTGGFMGSATAISLTNDNFQNPFWAGGQPEDSIVTTGAGGYIEFQLDQKVYPLTNEKEIGIFVAQKVLAAGGSPGTLFNGAPYRGTVSVSQDGSNWVAISTDTSLNAPTFGYDYQTMQNAWTYGTPGTSQSNLDALSVANYTTPMPDAGDALFNPEVANANASTIYGLRNNTSTSEYDTLLGGSGGGNWFSISDSGLAWIEYIRVDQTGGDIRFDAVFANSSALVIPEPATLVFLGVGSLALIRRRSVNRVV